MITKERLNEFIASAYKTACDHGFHDEEKSNAHWMMLVCTEVAEMVEADRKNRHAIYNAVEYCDKHVDEIDVQSRNRYFERDVKNTLEDETADVCIRLFDFMGMKGLEPEVFADKHEDWVSYFGQMSVCEQCYEMLQGISIICNESPKSEMAAIASGMILFCFHFAEHHGFNLEQHIVWKMKYNDLRVKLHGKNY